MTQRRKDAKLPPTPPPIAGIAVKRPRDRRALNSRHVIDYANLYPLQVSTAVESVPPHQRSLFLQQRRRDMAQVCCSTPRGLGACSKSVSLAFRVSSIRWHKAHHTPPASPASASASVSALPSQSVTKVGWKHVIELETEWVQLQAGPPVLTPRAVRKDWVRHARADTEHAMHEARAASTLMPIRAFAANNPLS